MSRSALRERDSIFSGESAQGAVLPLRCARRTLAATLTPRGKDRRVRHSRGGSASSSRTIRPALAACPVKP